MVSVVEITISLDFGLTSNVFFFLCNCTFKGLTLDTRVLMEGNLANEVGLIVLDTIELFCGHFKVSDTGHCL